MEDYSVVKESKHFATEFIGTNEDVISEILLRLPVKSVIRFKLVSKDWQSFISKPHFAIRHSQISLRKNPDYLSPRGLFFYHPGNQNPDYVPCESKKTHSPSLSFLESALGSLITVLHSCNGLLLCRFTSQYRFDCCICNLTTHEFSRVPQLPDHRPGSKFPAFGLVYNPLVSPHYKIICVRDLYQINDRKPSTRSTEVLVCSSENGTWISKGCFEEIKTERFMRKNSAFWNGRMYWIEYNKCYCLDVNSTEEIKLKTITSPGDQTRYWEDCGYLGEWCGHLHTIHIKDSDEDFHVYEFEEFSSEWFVKYTGNISRILSGFQEAVKKETLRNGDEITHYLFSILAMVRGDQEEDSALVLAIPGKVISYNFKTETVEVIRDMSANVVFTKNFYSFPYIETLSPVKAN